MKKFVFALAILSFIIACGNTSDTTNMTAQTTSIAKPDGEKIYKANCVACHGPKGDLGTAGAFNLKTSALSLEERIAVITNGRNTMTAFVSLLNKKEIKAVAQYTMTLSKQ
jgi:mono/diheme cytochrome c family protein